MSKYRRIRGRKYRTSVSAERAEDRKGISNDGGGSGGTAEVEEDVGPIIDGGGEISSRRNIKQEKICIEGD